MPGSDETRPVLFFFPKGYEQETDDAYKNAIKRGHIVVGVEIPDEEPSGRLAQAECLLVAAGGKLFKSV